MIVLYSILFTACFYHFLFWRYLNSSMTSFLSNILVPFPNLNNLSSCAATSSLVGIVLHQFLHQQISFFTTFQNFIQHYLIKDFCNKFSILDGFTQTLHPPTHPLNSQNLAMHGKTFLMMLPIILLSSLQKLLLTLNKVFYTLYPPQKQPKTEPTF